MELPNEDDGCETAGGAPKEPNPDGAAGAPVAAAPPKPPNENVLGVPEAAAG